MKMKKLLKRITKKDLLIIGVIALILLVYTSNFILPHYALDTYGIEIYGYRRYALNVYLVNGRPFMSLFLLFCKFFNLPYNGCIFASWLIGYFSLFIAIVTFYLLLQKFCNNRILTLFVSISIIFNLFCIEYYLFPDFTGIYCLGILFAILYSYLLIHYFETNKLKYLLFSLIFSVLTCFAYQGIISLIAIIPVIFTLFYSKNIKDFLKYNLITFIIYGVSAILNVLFTNFMGCGRAKINIELIPTIKKIWIELRYLMVTTNKILPNYWYLVFILIFIIILIFSILNRNHKKNNKNKSYILQVCFLIYSLLVILMISLAPYFLLGEDGVWITPRSTYSLGSILGFLGLFYILYGHGNQIKYQSIIEKIIIVYYVIYFICCLFGWINISTSRYLMNEYDEIHSLEIKDMISEYEQKNNIKVSKLKIYYDEFQNGDYGKIIVSKDMLASAYVSDWATGNIVGNFNNRIFSEAPNNSEIEKYCRNNDWKYFDKSQIKIINDSIYICLY